MIAGGLVVDLHVRLGVGREVSLSAEQLSAQMDALGIDVSMVAPDERAIAFDNVQGNSAIARSCADSGGRLLPYAVATPWRRDATEVLARARDGGAVALAIDPVLQGFDVLDGLVDPLVEFAGEAGWFVYIRTGTPPTALPLPVATLARRYPQIPFVMGRSGATDFWIDAAPALRHAQNLYADTSYAPWDTVLSEFTRDAQIGPRRCVFSTDSPYTVAEAEVRRIVEWSTIDDPTRTMVFGGVAVELLGTYAPSVK